MSAVTTGYAEFLATKRFTAPSCGIPSISASDLTADLFDHQKAVTAWALRKGRAAVFGDAGTGKSRIEAEWAWRVHCHTEGGQVLVLTPLAVASQWVREAAALSIPATYCRSQEDIPDGCGIVVTNYERLSAFDPSLFAGVVLDESSILKSYSGSTRNAIIEAFGATPFRLAATATPAPNDHTELGNHAEFLGVMTRTEMLATFFVHDGGDTSVWRLKGHAEADYWRWVATWAVAFKKPSDIGDFSDEGYVLPPLNIREHRVEVAADASAAATTLFGAGEALTMNDQRAAKRESLPERVAAVAAAVAAEPEEQWLIWCDLNAEGDALTAAIPGAVQVSGSDSPEAKEAALTAFAEGRLRRLVTKSSIAGFGLNFQGCGRQAFVGVMHSWEQFYQSVRRSWRYGRKGEVDIHVVYGDREGAILRNLRRKEEDAQRMSEAMVALMKEETMKEIAPDAETKATGRDAAKYRRDVARGRGWEMHLGDCVEVLREIPSDSIGYSIFSPPFASLYTYTNSDRDMGNCRNAEEFAAHFRFAVRELFRVVMPGRLVSFHCCNIPLMKERDGVIGLHDFRGDLIRLFQEEGWIYHSEVTIWKDPVTAMQRTKALGLLHKQLVKDSAMSRQGIPDVLVTMRKPGSNPVPVAGPLEDYIGTDQWQTAATFVKGKPGKKDRHAAMEERPTDGIRTSIEIWQRYASPVWMDINPSRTLQYQSAREEKDERHICPLQLDVIERALQLWSLPGDTVFSPFTGIGSEGYCAVKRGRRFVGSELKPSYWQQAVANLRRAEIEAGQVAMFSEEEHPTHV